MSQTITITKEKYEKLKKKAEIDIELVEKFKRAMEDLKHDRISEWKPKNK